MPITPLTETARSVLVSEPTHAEVLTTLVRWVTERSVSISAIAFSEDTDGVSAVVVYKDRPAQDIREEDLIVRRPAAPATPKRDKVVAHYWRHHKTIETHGVDAVNFTAVARVLEVDRTTVAKIYRECAEGLHPRPATA